MISSSSVDLAPVQTSGLNILKPYSSNTHASEANGDSAKLPVSYKECLQLPQPEIPLDNLTLETTRLLHSLLNSSTDMSFFLEKANTFNLSNDLTFANDLLFELSDTSSNRINSPEHHIVNKNLQESSKIPHTTSTTKLESLSSLSEQQNHSEMEPKCLLLSELSNRKEQNNKNVICSLSQHEKLSQMGMIKLEQTYRSLSEKSLLHSASIFEAVQSIWHSMNYLERIAPKWSQYSGTSSLSNINYHRLSVQDSPSLPFLFTYYALFDVLNDSTFSDKKSIMDDTLQMESTSFTSLLSDDDAKTKIIQMLTYLDIIRESRQKVMTHIEKQMDSNSNDSVVTNKFLLCNSSHDVLDFSFTKHDKENSSIHLSSEQETANEEINMSHTQRHLSNNSSTRTNELQIPLPSTFSSTAAKEIELYDDINTAEIRRVMCQGTKKLLSQQSTITNHWNKEHQKNDEKDNNSSVGNTSHALTTVVINKNTPELNYISTKETELLNSIILPQLTSLHDSESTSQISHCSIDTNTCNHNETNNIVTNDTEYGLLFQLLDDIRSALESPHIASVSPPTDTSPISNKQHFTNSPLLDSVALLSLERLSEILPVTSDMDNITDDLVSDVNHPTYTDDNQSTLDWQQFAAYIGEATGLVTKNESVGDIIGKSVVPSRLIKKRTNSPPDSKPVTKFQGKKRRTSVRNSTLTNNINYSLLPHHDSFNTNEFSRSNDYSQQQQPVLMESSPNLTTSTSPLGSYSSADLVTPCQGVCWDPTHQRWVAHWSDAKTHQRIRKYFNPKLLGFDRARLHAILTRKEAVDSGRASMMIKTERPKFVSTSGLSIHPPQKDSDYTAKSGAQQQSMNSNTQPLLISSDDPNDSNYLRGVYWSANEQIWYCHWKPNDSHDVQMIGFPLSDFMVLSHNDSQQAFNLARLKALQYRDMIIMQGSTIRQDQIQTTYNELNLLQQNNNDSITGTTTIVNKTGVSDSLIQKVSARSRTSTSTSLNHVPSRQIAAQHSSLSSAQANKELIFQHASPVQSKNHINEGLKFSSHNYQTTTHNPTRELSQPNHEHTSNKPVSSHHNELFSNVSQCHNTHKFEESIEQSLFPPTVITQQIANTVGDNIATCIPHHTSMQCGIPVPVTSSLTSTSPSSRLHCSSSSNVSLEWCQSLKQQDCTLSSTRNIKKTLFESSQKSNHLEKHDRIATPYVPSQSHNYSRVIFQ